MMTRDEFEKVVRAMKAEGVALTMPNLLVRTELPRALIEDWLTEMDKAPAASDSTKPPPGQTPPPGGAESGRKVQPTAAGEALDELDQLRQRVDRLRKGIVDKATETVVNKTLGLDDDPSPKGGREVGAQRRKKDLRVGGALGLLLGPFGLFYAAPYLTAGIAAGLYLVAVVGLNFVPLVGSAFLMYLIPLFHVASCVASAAYAWRYNRSGKRGPLFPPETPRTRNGG